MAALHEVKTLTSYSFRNMEERRIAITNGDTIVNCSNRDRCAAIYEYMEGRGKC